MREQPRAERGFHGLWCAAQPDPAGGQIDVRHCQAMRRGEFTNGGGGFGECRRPPGPELRAILPPRQTDQIGPAANSVFWRAMVTQMDRDVHCRTIGGDRCDGGSGRRRTQAAAQYDVTARRAARY